MRSFGGVIVSICGLQKEERILALLCPWADCSSLLRLLPAVIKAMMQNYIESMIIPNYPVQPNAKMRRYLRMGNNIDLRVTSIPKHLENSATNIISKILITKLSTNATARLLYVLSMNSMSICTRQCSNSRE